MPVVAVDEPEREIDETAEEYSDSLHESADDSAESFESAAPAPPIKGQSPVNENGAGQTGMEKPPGLESIVATIPEETRHALKELFRAEFSEVRRITKDELY